MCVLLHPSQLHGQVGNAHNQYSDMEGRRHGSRKLKPARSKLRCNISFPFALHKEDICTPCSEHSIMVPV